MELLLNLTWLLLALPAYWLWQGRNATRRFSSAQCLLALGCVLVILFPVISATDDLRAMRAEMEESPASERNLRQANTDNKPLLHAGWHSPAAVSGSAIFFTAVESWQHVSRPYLSTPVAPVIERAGRAPPSLFFV